MVNNKRNNMIKVSQNYSTKTNKKKVAYIKIQISICENPVITLKIAKGQNSFINNNFKNYLSEEKSMIQLWKTLLLLILLLKKKIQLN